jgi:hypothetical protein
MIMVVVWKAVAAINAVMLVLGVGELSSINALPWLHSALASYHYHYHYHYLASWQVSSKEAQSVNAVYGSCSHLGTTYTCCLFGQILLCIHVRVRVRG